jgi:hypothetical protein
VPAWGLENSRDLRLLRTRLGLSAEAFAARYDLPPEDYQLYEQARLAPEQGVMAYLRVILREPEVVARALAALAPRRTRTGCAAMAWTDVENPEWTAADFARARPAAEALKKPHKSAASISSAR